jgi:hypothetical protein
MLLITRLQQVLISLIQAGFYSFPHFPVACIITMSINGLS